MFAVQLVLLAVIAGVTFSNSQEVGNFIKTNGCKLQTICLYNYTATVQMTNKEEIDISAQVGLQCESVGTFQREGAIRHCITVEETVISVISNTSKDETNHISLDKRLSNWFCFAQSTASGRILAVFHPKDADPEIVNFKKSIVSAFQANYKGSSEIYETDTQSEHISHYQYKTIQRHRQIQRRQFNEYDVKRYARNSTNSKNQSKYVSFEEDDEIEIDSFNKRVYTSRGKTVIELKSRNDNDTEEEPLDTSHNLPKLGATTSYDLELIHCEIQNRMARNIPSSMMSGNGLTDNLLAKKDEVKKILEDMKELNDDIPPLHTTVSRVQRNAGSEKSGVLLQKWRRLLEMESKHGPLPGTQAKLPQIIERLQELKSQVSNVSNFEKFLLYHLLSSEGSLEAQKVLLDILNNQALPQEEYNHLLFEISLSPSIHFSTVDSLISYYKGLDHVEEDTSQCLLILSTLGRHINVQEKILSFLDGKFGSIVKGKNNTDDIILLIHALGNTGSKRIIPILLPYLHDPQFQIDTVDALRTVALDKKVQEAFIIVVKNAIYPEQVMAIIESLSFPFEHSVYFPEKPDHYKIKQSLLDVLMITAVRFHDTKLNKALKKYLLYIDNKDIKDKLVAVMKRQKRSSEYWASTSNSNYNLVASTSSRKSDVSNYRYYKAFLWSKQLGLKDIHIKVAAGAFGGIGIKGYKAYARGKVTVYVYGNQFSVVDVKYSYTRPFSGSLIVDKFAKTAGMTIKKVYSIITNTYSKAQTLPSSSIKVFELKYSHFIVFGMLDFYIEGRLGCKISFNTNADHTKVGASMEATPSITVSGGASASALEIYKIGLEVSATLEYSITPQTSAEACNKSPVGDATACLTIDTQRRGTISIYAYTQYRYVHCVWASCSIRWSRKEKVQNLSASWNISKSSQRLAKMCYVCDCYGYNPLNIMCNGPTSSGYGCSCRTQY